MGYCGEFDNVQWATTWNKDIQYVCENLAIVQDLQYLCTMGQIAKLVNIEQNQTNIFFKAEQVLQKDSEAKICT